MKSRQANHREEVTPTYPLDMSSATRRKAKVTLHQVTVVCVRMLEQSSPMDVKASQSRDILKSESHMTLRKEEGP